MFSVLPTLTAILACLVGLDLALEGSGPRLSVWALTAFAVIPIGEISLVEARWRARRGKGPGSTVWFRLLGALPVAGYAAASLLFGLPQIAFHLGIEGWILLDELLLIAPYPAAAAAGRIYQHRRASLFDPLRTWKQCRSAMLLGFRGEIALLVPLGFVVLAGDLFYGSGITAGGGRTELILFQVFLFSCLIGLVLFFPPLLRLIWGLKPITAGCPGNAAIVPMVDKLGYRVRAVLLWKTGGLMVNAAIIGFLPPLRYILVTDAMLSRFPPEELRAVIAHEVGHGKKKHTLLFIFHSLAFAALLAFCDARLSGFTWYRESLPIAAAFHLGAILVWIGFLFGILSRRFEMEADIFAARALGDPALFIGALDRIGRLNPTARRRGGWRHFSIDRRIALLESFFPGTVDPEKEPESPLLRRFEARMLKLKRGTLACSLVFLALFAAGLFVL